MTLRRACGLFLVAFLFLAVPSPVAAQEGGEKVTLNYFQRFVVDGGAMTWLILIPLSIVTLGLILEHALRTRPKELFDEELFEQLSSALRKGDLKSAWRLTGQEDGFAHAVTRRGLSELTVGPQAAQYAVIEATEEQASKLFSRIEYLNIIGNVAPMIGLIGTVYGIILAFNALAEVVRQGGVSRPDQLAEGISIALVNTFWGLVIAVPALGMYGLFRNRIDATAARIATRTIDLLKELGPEAIDDLRRIADDSAKES